MNDISELMDECASTHPRGWEYQKKMIHPIPNTSVVDRERFILERCRNKAVINFGCASGGLHGAIKSVANHIIGLDKRQPCDILIDFDNIKHEGPSLFGDLAICGEVLEHLSNPGRFLDYLWRFKMSIIFTVPNALSEIARRYANTGIESVNNDHVSWYSYHTMKVLLERHGFSNMEWYWYNGRAIFAEGLVVVAE